MNYLLVSFHGGDTCDGCRFWPSNRCILFDQDTSMGVRLPECLQAEEEAKTIHEALENALIAQKQLKDIARATRMGWAIKDAEHQIEQALAYLSNED